MIPRDYLHEWRQMVPWHESEQSALLSSPHDWNFDAPLERVSIELVQRMPGEPWAGDGSNRRDGRGES